MFGFGNDDKEELEENMEKIKEMINSGSRGEDEKEQKINELEKELRKESDQTDSADENFLDDFEPEDSIKEETEESESLENTGFETQEVDEPVEQEPGFEEEKKPQPDEPGVDFGRDEREKMDQRETEELENQISEREEKGQRELIRGTREDEEGLEGAVPEPPETKKLNVPEIEKGPLFIREGKFRKAREMIEEMNYLTQEIEQVVKDLEAGIEQDRKIEQDAKEILHRMNQDRVDVTEIISPGGD